MSSIYIDQGGGIYEVRNRSTMHAMMQLVGRGLGQVPEDQRVTEAFWPQVAPTYTTYEAHSHICLEQAASGVWRPPKNKIWI